MRAVAVVAVAVTVVVAAAVAAVVTAAARAMARVARAALAATTDKNQRCKAPSRSKSLPVSGVCHVQKFGSVFVELFIFVVGGFGRCGGAFSAEEKERSCSLV
jgi:hypothetical protein